jgi:hypothetical protein
MSNNVSSKTYALDLHAHKKDVKKHKIITQATVIK